MRKRTLAIGLSCLALGALIAVLVLSCAPTPSTQGTIDVKATLDGSAWTGAAQYTLTGPGAAAPTIINGASVPTTHRNVDPGSWTCAYVSGGPAGASFVNITPSSTQSLSAGSTITFTLNFQTTPAEELDHFKCYRFHVPAYNPQSTYYVGQNVELEDQFDSVEAKVEYAEYFCNPAKKTYDGEVTEISNPDNHLTLYGISGVTTQKWVVDVNNQFGEQTLHVSGPTMLAVPTQKEGHDEPEGLDHFLLYWVWGGQDLNVVVQLEDQFNLEPDVVVYRPVAFANPVQKTTDDGDVTEIENSQAHLVFYEIVEDETFQTDVNIANQFHTVTVSMPQSTRYINMLAVPSQKLSFGPPPSLDHFKFYEVVSGPDADLVLPKVGDQFYTGVQEVEVQSLRYFGNPVAKTYDGVLTSIGDSDHHLTLYDITTPTVQNWVVEVDNQFGKQELTVSGPVMLAVPTQKEEHGWPVWLDHFLLYKVIEGEDVQVTVDLEDQWHKESDVEVHRPVYFANPAGKISPYVDWYPGQPLIIENPDEHLVFYEIVGETYQGNVRILNQLFREPEQETISVSDPTFLAVPSEKISFEPVEIEVLDHFNVYWVDWVQQGDVVEEVVQLEDQFGAFEATVMYSEFFANPAEKTCDGVVTPILNPNHHLTLYLLSYEEEPPMRFVEVNNQFGKQELMLYGPVWLAVPTQKEGHGPPVGLDHFLLYIVAEGPSMQEVVQLEDQFYDEVEVMVAQPVYFANPVKKTDATGMVTEIVNTDVHLVFYTIDADLGEFETDVNVANQFTGDTFVSRTVHVWGPDLLAVPSEKISFEEVESEPTLDHFLSYIITEAVPLQAHVYLEDQFCIEGAVGATVDWPWWFCNPVEKWHEGVMTLMLDEDHHLTVYGIHPEMEAQHWVVNVNNQFGTQPLTVYGPVALAVPTQKVEPGGHGPPVGLDHYLLYAVIEGPYFEDVVVGLDDQFHDIAEGEVIAPRYFANPVQKTDDTGMVTEIVNRETHLVFYEIICGQYSYPQVLVVNQFGEQAFALADPIFLAAPSQKISWEEWLPQ